MYGSSDSPPGLGRLRLWSIAERALPVEKHSLPRAAVCDSSRAISFLQLACDLALGALVRLSFGLYVFVCLRV